MFVRLVLARQVGLGSRPVTLSTQIFTTVVPYPGFGRVELDVRMLLQFVGKDVVCCFDSVGGDDEVDVVQVGIQAFPGL